MLFFMHFYGKSSNLAGSHNGGLVAKGRYHCAGLQHGVGAHAGLLHWAHRLHCGLAAHVHEADRLEAHDRALIGSLLLEAAGMRAEAADAVGALEDKDLGPSGQPVEIVELFAPDEVLVHPEARKSAQNENEEDAAEGSRQDISC